MILAKPQLPRLLLRSITGEKGYCCKSEGPADHGEEASAPNMLPPREIVNERAQVWKLETLTWYFQTVDVLPVAGPNEPLA